MNSKRAIVLLAPLAVAGCMGSDSMVSDVSNWGEANRQTFAAQVVNPDPQYDYAVPTRNGETTAKAIERYRKGEVKKPERVQTSGIGGAGGGSSASGSGGN